MLNPTGKAETGGMEVQTPPNIEKTGLNWYDAATRLVIFCKY